MYFKSGIRVTDFITHGLEEIRKALVHRGQAVAFSVPEHLVHTVPITSANLFLIMAIACGLLCDLKSYAENSRMSGSANAIWGGSKVTVHAMLDVVPEESVV